jgi:diguanylate cyclase (GGDEF)-like protein
MLADNRYYMLAVVLTVYWAGTFANFLGMRISGLLSLVCVISGTIIPGILIIALGMMWLAAGSDIAITLSFAKLVPDLSNIHNVVFLAGAVLMFAGMEVSAAYSHDVRDARRTYPRAILLSAVVARSLSSPMNELSDLAARLAQGNLELRHSERGIKEVARMGRQVNRLAEQLESLQIELTRATTKAEGEVKGRTRYLEQTTRTMIDLANRDPLTGLANRRRLELELERHIEMARQSDNPLAVIMMDLDNFKRYNDTAGHLAGDNLLRTVADALRARTRITDLVVRWGGDEFCILIPYTPPDRAVAAARSLIESVSEATRSLPDAEDVVGASAGVACYPDDAQDGTALIAAADAALYQVKESERGHVLRLADDTEAG